jgi:hypothetical protein
MWHESAGQPNYLARSTAANAVSIANADTCEQSPIALGSTSIGIM